MLRKEGRYDLHTEHRCYRKYWTKSRQRLGFRLRWLCWVEGWGWWEWRCAIWLGKMVLLGINWKYCCWCLCIHSGTLLTFNIYEKLYWCFQIKSSSMRLDVSFMLVMRSSSVIMTWYFGRLFVSTNHLSDLHTDQRISRDPIWIVTVMTI